MKSKDHLHFFLALVINKFSVHLVNLTGSLQKLTYDMTDMMWL